MKNLYKNQRGSMTVYVAVTVLCFIFILTGLFMSAASTREAQLKTIIKIVEAYQKDNERIEEIYAKRVGVIGLDETPGKLDGTGTEDDPYKIESIEDLVFFLNEINNSNHYKDRVVELTRNLDVEEDKSYADPKTEMFKDYNGDNEIKGLKEELMDRSHTGLKFPNGYFSGTFKGNNYSISNIYSNVKISGEKTYYGLLGENKGQLQDLSLFGSINTNGTGLSIRVGIFAGKNSGTIKNCTSNFNTNVNLENTTITDEWPSFYVGNIIGNNEGTIESCTSNGSITIDKKMTLKQNGGSQSDYVGGIVGNNEGTIKKCYNYTEINEKYPNTQFTSSNLTIYTGGIVARTRENTAVSNCENYANVNMYIGSDETTTKVDSSSGMTFYIGGIAGYTEETSNVEGCVNNAQVLSKCNNLDYSHSFELNIGGIVGQSHRGNITNCTNNNQTISEYNNIKSSYEAYTYIGGITGYNYKASISNCTNNEQTSLKYENIISSKRLRCYVGGISGYNYKGSDGIGTTIDVTNNGNTQVECKNNIELTGSGDMRYYTGGVIGNNAGLIKNARNYGKMINDLNITFNTTSYSKFETGGITGENNSTVLNAISGEELVFNFAKSDITDVESRCQIGGIAGYNEGDAYLRNVVNYGNVTCTTKGKRLEIGGIVGKSNNNKAVMENAYNKGNVQVNADSDTSTLRLGGIAGDCEGVYNIVINAGNITSNLKKSTMGIIGGDGHSDTQITKSKYLKISGLEAVEGKDFNGTVGLDSLSDNDAVTWLNEGVQELNPSNNNELKEWVYTNGTISFKN